MCIIIKEKTRFNHKVVFLEMRQAILSFLLRWLLKYLIQNVSNHMKDISKSHRKINIDLYINVNMKQRLNINY